MTKVVERIVRLLEQQIDVLGAINLGSILGIALTVTPAVFLMALLAGLDRAFVTSGDPQNVLVLRKGSTAELSGGFDANLFPTLKNLPGIAKDSHGEPLASGEWVVVIVLPRKSRSSTVFFCSASEADTCSRSGVGAAASFGRS